MAYHKFVHRLQSSQGYRPKKDGYIKAHRSAFNPGPYYKPSYTERQQAIINGDDVPNLRKNEVTVLIKKAEHFERYELAEQLREMYYDMYNEVHPGDPSYEEALKILDELTPDDLKKK